MNGTTRLNPETAAAKLSQCGLVHHQRQVDSYEWIGPPEGHADGTARVKTMPLHLVKPEPMMEIRAHGERYEIPHDFRGNWFDVVSPTGKALIP